MNIISVIINLNLYVPGTFLSSILRLQPSKTRSFPIKTRVIWVPGIYIYIFAIGLLFCVDFQPLSPLLNPSSPLAGAAFSLASRADRRTQQRTRPGGEARRQVYCLRRGDNKNPRRDGSGQIILATENTTDFPQFR